MVEKTMDKIVALAKSRGFVYPGSEIVNNYTVNTIFFQVYFPYIYFVFL